MSKLSSKEVTPVLYDASGLKLLEFHNLPSNFILFHMHWHERMELLLVTSGSLYLKLSDYETVLTSNQLAIITPGQLHSGIAGENGVSFQTIMFDISSYYTSLHSIEKLLRPIAEQEIAFCPWTDHPEILRLFEALYKPSEPDDLLAPLSKVGKIYELFTLLYRYCPAKKEKKTETEQASHNQFQSVLTYIDLHFYEEISSEKLSRIFGYSEGYFCRQFKAVTGLTPMNYIRILRLEKAQEMLQKQELSLNEIAIRCGFSNANYFSRCFKSHFKMTPTEYARQQKGLPH